MSKPAYLVDLLLQLVQTTLDLVGGGGHSGGGASTLAGTNSSLANSLLSVVGGLVDLQAKCVHLVDGLGHVGEPRNIFAGGEPGNLLAGGEASRLDGRGDDGLDVCLE